MFVYEPIIFLISKHIHLIIQLIITKLIDIM